MIDSRTRRATRCGRRLAALVAFVFTLLAVGTLADAQEPPEPEASPVEPRNSPFPTGEDAVAPGRLAEELESVLRGTLLVDPDATGTAADADRDDSLREKTIYVPYEKFSEVFGKDDHGVFLPYKEFLELWLKAQKKPEKPEDIPPPAEAVLSGGRYEGEVRGDVARLSATYEVQALKEKGWSVLKLGMSGVAVESAEVVALDGPGAANGAAGGDAAAANGAAGSSRPQRQPSKLVPIFTGTGGEYAVFFPQAGSYEIRLTIAVRVESKPGMRSLAFQIPAAAISTLDLKIPEENSRVEVTPQSAAAEVAYQEGRTHLIARLGNATSVGVSWSPPAGKVQEEDALLLASQQIRAYLGERVLRVRSGVYVQILNQEVGTFRVRIPQNMQVLSLDGENIREWNILEQDNVLQLSLHSPVEKGYTFQIDLEQVLEQTPESVTINFPQVEDVLRESGHVALGYDDSLRVRVASQQGLSQRDLDEIPAGLRDGSQVGFRYLAHPLQLGLDVEKILPVVHATTTSVVLFGVEEDLWVGWVDYKITRSGVFGLRLQVPARWRVVSLGEEGKIEDFQTSTDADGDRILSVNLKSRAFGTYRLPFRFSAEGSASAGNRTVNALRVLDVESDRGVLGIGAPRAFRLTTVSQERMISADVQELFRSGILSHVPQESDASLAFTYNDHPASVEVNLEARRTEIKVTSRVLVNVRDSVVELSQDMEYLVQYAPVDALSFSAPEALDERLQVDVRGFKERKKIGARDGRSIWQVSLQSKTLGIVTLRVSTDLELTNVTAGEPRSLPLPHIQAETLEGAEVRSESGAVAIRKDGGLQIRTPEANIVNLESIDPRELPPELAQGQIYQAFKFNEPNYALTLDLVVRDYLKLPDAVVQYMQVRAHISEEELATCVAVLLVESSGRQSLDLGFPAGSELLSTLVNGRSVQPSRPAGAADAGRYQVSVPLPGRTQGAQAIAVRLDYRVRPPEPTEMGLVGSVALKTPVPLGDDPGVPVGKIEVDLYLPEGYRYVDRQGNLHLRDPRGRDPWQGVKNQLWGLLGVHQQQTPVVHATSPAEANVQQVFGARGGAIDLKSFQQGQHFRLHGSHAEAEVSFDYIGASFYRVVFGLIFLAALVAGALLVRQRPDDRLWWLGGLSALALLISWLIGDARAGLWLAGFFGGVLVLIGLAVTRASQRTREVYRSWRAERNRLAPDPFLEEAEAKAQPEASGGAIGVIRDGSRDKDRKTESTDRREGSEEKAKSDEERTSSKDDDEDSGDEKSSKRSGDRSDRKSKSRKDKTESSSKRRSSSRRRKDRKGDDD